jgi:hypothetical protein
LIELILRPRDGIRLRLTPKQKSYWLYFIFFTGNFTGYFFTF